MPGDPADRDGMFTNIRVRVLEDGSTAATCTRCGALVDIYDAAGTRHDAHVCNPASAEDPPDQDY